MDLADASRLARSVSNRRFIERVFAPEEIQAFVDDGNRLRLLARAFAQKEALMKALGTGWARGIAFSEIVGPPVAEEGTLELRGRALELADQAGVRGISASCTFRGDIAIAVVMLLA